jgi:hypothetical protein
VFHARAHVPPRNYCVRTRVRNEFNRHELRPLDVCLRTRDDFHRSNFSKTATSKQYYQVLHQYTEKILFSCDLSSLRCARKTSPQQLRASKIKNKNATNMAASFH